MASVPTAKTASPLEGSVPSPHVATAEVRVPALVRARHAASYIARALAETWRTFRTAPRGDRAELAAMVLRMRAKHFLIKLAPRWNFRGERVFGWNVECFDYYELITTIEIIFLSREYRFAPRSTRPRILDCGSNIGVSLLFFKKEFPDCTIQAFEPDPQTFALLRKNVEQNSLAGVELYNRAVAGAAGERDFFCDPAHPGSTSMSLRPECRLLRRETVEAVLLSDFVGEGVDLLKLDVEGAELEVIEELVRSGAIARIHQIVVEYHPALFPGKEGLGWLRQTLEASGFGCETRSGEATPDDTSMAYPITLYARRDAAGCPARGEMER